MRLGNPDDVPDIPSPRNGVGHEALSSPKAPFGRIDQGRLRVAALAVIHAEQYIQLGQPSGLLLKFSGMGELLSQFLPRSPYLFVEALQLLPRLAKAFGDALDGVLDARQVADHTLAQLNVVCGHSGQVQIDLVEASIVVKAHFEPSILPNRPLVLPKGLGCGQQRLSRLLLPRLPLGVQPVGLAQDRDGKILTSRPFHRSRVFFERLDILLRLSYDTRKTFAQLVLQRKSLVVETRLHQLQLRHIDVELHLLLDPRIPDAERLHLGIAQD